MKIALITDKNNFFINRIKEGEILCSICILKLTIKQD